jgi:hypothetical protein
MRIASGKIVEKPDRKAGSRKGGLKGGAARAKSLSAEQRKKIAQDAAKKRWDKN